MIDIDFVIGAYSASPNNATGKLVDELLRSNPSMKKPGNAMEVEMDSKVFTVTISPNRTLEARQFREDNNGLITLSVLEKKVFYISKEKLTLSKTATRIANDGSRFFNAKVSPIDAKSTFDIADYSETEPSDDDEVFSVKTIYKTSDYSKFKGLSGQPRERAKKNAIKLSPEIKNTGGNYLPIIVNEDFEIIDGNTRLEACRALSLPLIYEVIKSDDINSLELMRYMNAANNPWNIYNFIEFYSLGYKTEEFIAFKEFVDSKPYSIGIYTAFNNAINQDDIKLGRLPTIDYDMMQEKVDFLSGVIVLVGDSISSKQNIARALERFFKYGKFDKERMLSSLSAHWFKVLKKEKMNKVIGEYLVASTLQKCYNYSMSGTSRVRLFEEEL